MAQESLEEAARIAEIESIKIDAAISEDIPEKYKQKDGVFIVIDDSPSEMLGHRAYRVINNSSETIRYIGYSASSPWYRVQNMVDDNWTDVEVGWFCGTGLRICSLPPHRSVVFSANLDHLKTTARTGLDLVDPENPLSATTEPKSVVWSDQYPK